MSDDPPFEPPTITDEDVRWSSRLLKLPDGAFHGETGTDPRQDVLKSMERIDVTACPGSGKTTLLVAKLAILAEKWQYRTRGICVLSHTNAARREIEGRLGNTAAGQRLLAYPHFIGTIHAFVNDLLAIPWLRSRGFPIKMIDDDEVERRRRALMAKRQFSALRRFVQENEKYVNLVRGWIVASPEFAVLKTDGQPAFKNPGRSASQLTRLVEIVTRNGYHRFSEMFMWAGELMDKIPGVAGVLRDRFPMLFLDEAQDNSEEQSQILYRIFLEGDAPAIRQRFGDPNQAVFNSVEEKGAATDVFPGMTTKELPNSHRFGPNIAQLAGPLGVTQYDGGLIGQGPSMHRLSRSQEGRHAILFFGDDDAGKVLETYGSLLLDAFSEQELRRGTFVAVGQVHKPKGDDQKPRHVGHYWPDYDPELSKAEPKPQTLVQYVFAGQGKAEAIGEAYPAVEKIAEGILRLAGMAEGGTTLRPRRQCHRTILQLLESEAVTQACYKILVARFALGRKTLTKMAWDTRWRAVVRKIAEAIAGASMSSPEADDFLVWKAEAGPDPPAATIQRSRDNIYRYPNDGPKVHIRVGSIHSVKGETHTATLVLETFWQDKKERHNLELLLPWLDGSESGARSAKKHQTARLKLHYVAMTRPTHLLCLAMKRSTLEDGEGKPDQGLIAELERHGWRVKVI